MRYLLAVIDSASETASGNEIAAIDAFNDRLRDGGHWVLAAGIEPPARRTLIDARPGATGEGHPPAPSDTPFVAGFWIIEARDRAEAEALARDGSRACNRIVEVRAFLR